MLFDEFDAFDMILQRFVPHSQNHIHIHRGLFSIKCEELVALRIIKVSTSIKNNTKRDIQTCKFLAKHHRAQSGFSLKELSLMTKCYDVKHWHSLLWELNRAALSYS